MFEKVSAVFDGKRELADTRKPNSPLIGGKLGEHLAETDSTCQERMSRMIPQMAAAEGVNEALKARDPMAWVGRMNSIHHGAEETILEELICA